MGRQCISVHASSPLPAGRGEAYWQCRLRLECASVVVGHACCRAAWCARRDRWRSPRGPACRSPRFLTTFDHEALLHAPGGRTSRIATLPLTLSIVDVSSAGRSLAASMPPAFVDAGLEHLACTATARPRTCRGRCRAPSATWRRTPCSAGLSIGEAVARRADQAERRIADRADRWRDRRSRSAAAPCRAAGIRAPATGRRCCRRPACTRKQASAPDWRILVM